jgi:hypothetical protein
VDIARDEPSLINMTPFVPARIVSGGQTGVDRGALEAAIALGIEHGGWCPQDRMAEDGSVPSRYLVVELEGADYVRRTEQNIVDSDATLIFSEGSLFGGTRLTQKVAVRLGKPYFVQPLGRKFSPERVKRWLAEIKPHTLNVAGPRESKNPGIQQRSFEALMKILERDVL